VQPAIVQQTEPAKQATTTAAYKASPAYKQANSYPKISGNTTRANQPNQITVNNLDGVQAPQTTTQAKFADQIGVKENKLRKLNDLEEAERIEAGKYYYTEKKKPSAEIETHVVQPGESLWSISQKYGIRLSALKSKNRIRRDTELKVGMILNLQEPRKRGEEIPVMQISTPAPQRQAVAVATKELEPAPAVSTVQNPSRNLDSSRITHSVAAGETLFAISKKYGVTVDQLKSWNNIGSQNIISVGQKLVILKP
jgi:membrane-bound lytic murein transglycosylase D